VKKVLKSGIFDHTPHREGVLWEEKLFDKSGKIDGQATGQKGQKKAGGVCKEIEQNRTRYSTKKNIV
jgi:hypothetical protein